MKKDDRDWLRNLQEELWEHHPGIPGRSYGHTSEKRNLTEDEWTRLKTLMTEEDDLMFSLGTNMGFSLLIRIMECNSYPGTPPEGLLQIGQKQIPAEGIDGPTYGGSGDSWQLAWDILTPFTHSDRNAEKLAFHKLDAPRERQHYEY